VDFDCAQHGIGFKVSAMRLADTCLVLSKCRPRNQFGAQYLSVGLLSKNAFTDSKSLTALSVVFQIKNNETFIPLTPFPEDILSHMLKITGNLFANELELKRYVLNEMDRYSGTKFLLTNLRQQDGVPELITDKGDIKIGQKWQEVNLLKTLETSSLSNYLRVMYITHPTFARCAINGVQLGVLENPFNLIPLESFTDH
jgi:hypothetical protein